MLCPLWGNVYLILPLNSIPCLFTAKQNINVSVTYCSYLNLSDCIARLATAACLSQYHTSKTKLRPRSKSGQTSFLSKLHPTCNCRCSYVFTLIAKCPFLLLTTLYDWTPPTQSGEADGKRSFTHSSRHIFFINTKNLASCISIALAWGNE